MFFKKKNIFQHIVQNITYTFCFWLSFKLGCLSLFFFFIGKNLLCRNFTTSMGAKNRVGIGLLYRPASLHSLAESIPWNRFLGSLKVYKYCLWDRNIQKSSLWTFFVIEEDIVLILYFEKVFKKFSRYSPFIFQRRKLIHIKVRQVYIFAFVRANDNITYNLQRDVEKCQGTTCYCTLCRERDRPKLSANKQEVLYSTNRTIHETAARAHWTKLYLSIVFNQIFSLVNFMKSKVQKIKETSYLNRNTVTCKLYPSDRQSHANCTQVAARCRQISVNFIMSHATGSHTGKICKRLASTRAQFVCN